VVSESADGPFDVPRLAMELERDPTTATVVLATAGDVNGGRFDPIRSVAALCERHGAWLHIDGAFGLFARASPRSADLLDGVEAADSVVCDAHKWLNVPYDCGILFVKRRSYLEGAFKSAPAFEGHVQSALSDVSPENSRRARGVVLWATLNAYGRSGYQRLVERHLELAQRLSRQVVAAPDFELLLPTTLNVVAFRYRPPAVDQRDLDALNTCLGDMLTGKGVYVGTLARIQGNIGFRPVLLNWRTGIEDIDGVLPAIRDAADALNESINPRAIHVKSDRRPDDTDTRLRRDSRA
jgi:glutamate/tyrosine decarboxylase-like PLP-dependent enzyme